MDFKDQIKQLSERIVKLKDSIQTEEAAKNAFIMPFIQILGYDVFNPLEVIPEMICDVGIKKGEKIDYAITNDGAPIILIECKHWRQSLDLCSGQLLRYFHVSKARFGLLTNGIKYKFYTDLVEPNKLDETPFLELDMEHLDEIAIEEVKKFHKSYFNVESILSSATGLKYTSELKNIVQKEFSNPSPDFVKLLARQVYPGPINQTVLSQFTILVKDSIQRLINEIITCRLNSAINCNEKVNYVEKDIFPEKEKEIATTPEELEGFYVVKSILRTFIGSSRITYRDAISYFAIFIDDNNRKPVCRLYLNSSTNKRMCFIGEDKKEIAYKLSSIDDIYQYSENLIKAVEKFSDGKIEIPLEE